MTVTAGSPPPVFAQPEPDADVIAESGTSYVVARVGDRWHLHIANGTPAVLYLEARAYVPKLAEVELTAFHSCDAVLGDRPSMEHVFRA